MAKWTFTKKKANVYFFIILMHAGEFIMCPASISGLMVVRSGYDVTKMFASTKSKYHESFHDKKPGRVFPIQMKVGHMVVLKRGFVVTHVFYLIYTED